MAQIKTLSCDIETYSDVDLVKCGVYKYADSPNFEILLFAYSVDDGEIQIIDLANGEELPPAITAALMSPKIKKTAFNAQFERCCLSKYLNTTLDPAQWYCTAIQAAELSLPASLADVGAALGLERQKISEGKELIKYFCVPCRPTKANGGRTRNMPWDAPEKWERFKEYCMRDVDVERQIAEKLKKYPISKSEHDLYVLDQKINDRGVLVDLQLAEQAVKMNRLQTAVATEQAYALTGLENPNSVAQLKDWLIENGIEIECLSKKAVKALADETDGDVQEVLHLRLLMSKTSVKKYEAVARSVCHDNRVRGLLRFYGANRTGRWCLAQGTMVTVKNTAGDIYERPIETVEKSDMVFDGENWVHHDGVVYSGDHEVIFWDGITATPEHKVFISNNTKITLREAKERGLKLWRGKHTPYTR